MIKISTIEYYLPEKVLSNNDLEALFPEWNSEKIEEKVGISQRHISGEHETVLDLAIKASEKIFKNYNRDEVDFILFCTQSPDYFLPTTACLLQDRLGLRKDIGALDFNLGCSGYIYGLAMARGLLQAGIAKSILLVTSETYTKHLHPEDKSNRSIFGDGAAATILEFDPDKADFKFTLGTDGSGAEKLIVKKGGFRNVENISPEAQYPPEYLYMDGPGIFNFTIENIPPLINKTLEENYLQKDDIDFFIFHQANSFMLNYLRKKMKIPVEKFYIGMSEYGNTVSATIPIAIKDAADKNLIKKGDKVLLAGFGVGLSWGATIIEF